MNLSKYFENWPVNDVAAAVVGSTEAEHGDVDRIFHLMSVTKLFSAYAFLMAVEEGVFELDQPAGPEGSTVRHLLAHASGVGFASREQERPLGERRIYSSAGFEWLADILEEETGIAMRHYARDGVFRPLGMDDTAIYGSPGHDGRSTVADMEKFARELLQPTLLHESTVREAFTPQFPELRGLVPGYGMQKPCPWGLGFEIRGRKAPHWMGTGVPEETVGHFGMAGTYLWAVPSWSDHELAGTAAICLTNRQFGNWAKPLWEDTNTSLADELLTLK
ncbi:serine hydrolase domain-containing protein [Corynebacterium breve]|uniref:Serine hydrolase domain-containing protein n=1 Tax=Corynebacterium breve TaxID=3049799 RepID=A0ABY8VC90_9CORY|nr:serine hydrolase domain-containing protein [Corynebacterium breve]WIM67049.1 serine hydrolase domain-containing protein [Corynebacterium breve]